jgi:hypothetical protein
MKSILTAMWRWLCEDGRRAGSPGAEHALEAAHRAALLHP